MRINHNISSMVTQASLFKTSRAVGKNLEKLSTGLRINRSADDAAGLGVSENLRAQVRGIHQATKNTQDVISMLNIAEGSLNEMSNIFQRMRELVIQARNETYTQVERNYLGDEFEALGLELDRIAQTTNYNGMQIFADINTANSSTGDPKGADDATDIWAVGSEANSVFGANDDGAATHFNIMVGQNFTATDIAAFNTGATQLNNFDNTAANFITIQMGQMDLQGLFNKNTTGVASLYSGFDRLRAGGSVNIFDGSGAGHTLFYGGTQGKLNCILEIMDGKTISALPVSLPNFTGWADTGTNYTGIERINRMRSYIGATINRLEHNLNNLMEQEASQQAAESQIRNTDFAKETALSAKNRILTQSAVSMLAQANVQPQSVLHLLR